jgi:flagellin
MASFSVISNIASANAQANLHSTQIGLQKALNRLSSGFRINTSGDDAAGLVTANAYRQDIAVISQGIRNANDGLSDLQIKDGALNNVATLLDRLSTLATQSASGTTSAASRTTLQAEFADVLSEIDREVTVAGLNTDAGFSVFVSNDGANGQVTGTIQSVMASDLGIGSLSIATQAGAETAVSSLATAVENLGTSQAKIGSSPSASRSRSRSTTRPPRAGSATPTWPRNPPT